MTKTILVTGANRGIGLEMVKQYAEQGFNVLACCRDPNKAAELQKLHQSNNKITLYQLDVSDLNDIKKLAEQLKNQPIDILFNNAGVAGKDLLFGQLDYDDLLSTIKVNSIGPMMVAQNLLDNVIQGNSKIIVNISSMLGSIELNQDDSWGWLSYRVSKTALNSATRCMANQLKTKNVIVITMNPGWVQTDMGGKNAFIKVEESVTGIRNVVKNISLKDSGNFFDYDGKPLPW